MLAPPHVLWGIDRQRDAECPAHDRGEACDLQHPRRGGRVHEPFVEVLRQRRREHEEDGVGRADSAENTAARAECADDRRQAVHEHHRQREIRASTRSGNGARNDAEQRRHAGEEQQAQRVQPDADPHGAIVSAPKIFCSRPGDTTNAGASSARYIDPGVRPPEGPVRRDRPRGRASPRCQPPNRDTASGSAMANPAIFTVSCTTLTHADVSSPPAAKYTVITTPPIGAADRLGNSGDDVQDPAEADQLRREDEERADPEQHRR